MKNAELFEDSLLDASKTQLTTMQRIGVLNYRIQSLVTSRHPATLQTERLDIPRHHTIHIPGISVELHDDFYARVAYWQPATRMNGYAAGYAHLQLGGPLEGYYTARFTEEYLLAHHSPCFVTFIRDSDCWDWRQITVPVKRLITLEVVIDDIVSRVITQPDQM